MAGEPYSVLGLKKAATSEDIKKAYRTLAKKYHPDLHKGDKAAERRFQEVSAAYSFLSDATRKSRYDRGEIDANGNPLFAQGFASGSQRRTSRASQSDAPFDDIFDDLFRTVNPRRGSSPKQGSDAQQTLVVTFLEAARGTKRKIEFDNGKTLEVTVPAGSTDGQILRLKGQGNTGFFGGKAGDALVKLKVQAHSYYSREGLDILLTLPISLPEAVLGGNADVPTIHGAVTLKIPPNASSGMVLRLKGKGIQPETGTPGDQLVRLQIQLPSQPDSALQAAIAKWAAKAAYNPRTEWK